MPRLHKGRIDTIINSFVTILGAIMTDIAISVKHLTKVYKLYQKPSDRLKEALNPFKKSYHEDFYALNDVSFEIKKGETVGIIGKNGAGKSTLLKIITGVLTPTSGSVQVHGKIASLLELGAGFNPDYTGLENIYFQGSLMGYTRAEMDAKVDEILAFADIGDFVHQPVKSYSSGMFARLAFAVAINVEPDVLIVDEALSVGDAAFQIKCFNKMQSLLQLNKTILFVSHDTYSVRNFCSSAAWIDHGKLKIFGKPNDVINDYINANKGETEDTSNKQNGRMIENIVNSDVQIIYNGKIEKTIKIGDPLSVNFLVKNTSNQDLSITYVFNLYRKIDNFYICGATSLMDIGKSDKISAYSSKNICLTFPNLPLLTGMFRLRIAINDAVGMGVLCDLKEAVILSIEDHHESEGLINIQRNWSIKNEK